jgi:L,D-peptidoglycan transpeptidase YkuD (ErfK/YbiS/YcfS/YnhG family)
VAAPVVGATPALADEIAPRRTASPTTTTAAPRRWYPWNKASRLRTLPAQTTQVVIVTGNGYATTYAWLETFAKVGGIWRPVSAPLACRIGSQGFSDNHLEGIPTTPTGVYSIGDTMYGIASNPGVRYPYHVLVSGDWWNENSDSPGYNSFHHGSDPGGPSEALWQISPAYTHFAVITYNMAPNVPSPIPGQGSGIFLHQHSASGGPTAGCVSLGHTDLVAVLNWLNPAASPRIVLSPIQTLSRY